ncbi:MAG TPA: hypothetical protein VG267_21520 [Terracidiphilus sp.]|jgi:hypothetical protein|nr:hypothetical protein [Terracidiphilus sp.]
MGDRTPLRIRPELKQLVAEASRALACLDAERLEDLAGCCQALNRDLPPRAQLRLQAQEAKAGMETFARVLEVTRANLNVMRRLRELRQGAAAYPSPKDGRHWAGDGHGNN